MTTTCFMCAEPVSDDATRCPHCDATLEPARSPSVAPAPDGRSCPACAEAVGPNDARCPHCGTTLGVSEASAPPVATSRGLSATSADPRPSPPHEPLPTEGTGPSDDTASRAPSSPGVSASVIFGIAAIVLLVGLGLALLTNWHGSSSPGFDPPPPEPPVVLEAPDLDRVTALFAEDSGSRTWSALANAEPSTRQEWADIAAPRLRTLHDNCSNSLEFCSKLERINPTTPTPRWTAVLSVCQTVREADGRLSALRAENERAEREHTSLSPS